MQLDKQNLIQQVIEKLTAELDFTRETMHRTQAESVNEETKAENEYDTRGLEAGYLAGGLSKKVMELEEMISICKFLQPKNFTEKEKIAATAIVELQNINTRKSITVFILPKVGGITLSVAGKTIQVISPLSKLGDSILNLGIGDDAFIETDKDTIEYEITGVW